MTLSAPASTLRRSAPATTSSRAAKKRAVVNLASRNALSSPPFAEQFLRHAGHLEPHPAEADEPHQLHVGVGSRAGIVGVGHAILGKPHRRALQMAERLLERLDEPATSPAAFASARSAADHRRTARTPRPPSLASLRPTEVECLDAIGAFVNLGDARVADELLHAPFADIAVAAEHLLGIDRGLEPAIGEVALDHRGKHRNEVVGGSGVLPRSAPCGFKSTWSEPHRMSARAASLKARPSSSMRRTVGVDEGDCRPSSPARGLRDEARGPGRPMSSTSTDVLLSRPDCHLGQFGPRRPDRQGRLR